MSQFPESAEASGSGSASPSVTETRSVATVAELDTSIVQHARQIRHAYSIRNIYAGLYSSSHAGKIWQLAKAYLIQDVR